MKFTILEEAVLCAALERYISYCESCLSNPENREQAVFIESDIKVAAKLKDTIMQDYQSQGGSLDLL